MTRWRSWILTSSVQTWVLQPWVGHGTYTVWSWKNHLDPVHGTEVSICMDYWYLVIECKKNVSNLKCI